MMATDPCLVLYGNSVFLAGIQAELEREATLELITLDTGSPDALNLTRARRPRAVLYDLNLAQPHFAIPLLLEQPGLMLIGVDASRDELLILCSYPVQALSVHDLVRLILEQAPDPNEARQRREGFHS
jgi:hypothetical protein